MNGVTTTGDKELDTVLEKIPEDDRHIIVQRMGVMLAASSKSFSGPLPPPEDMRLYEHVQKGSADRIISILEKQVDHRVTQEANVIKYERNQNRRGQWFGFILCMFLGGGAILLGLKGHDILAGTICTVLIVALAVIFVLNQYPSFMNSKEKS